MDLLPNVILVNLGTPDQANVASVRKYLREFLMDKRVINIPAFFRWILVHLIILPFRPKKSTAAYKKVWTKEGSPLMVHGKNLTNRVQEQLKGKAHVRLAMRYGNPSLQACLEQSKATGGKLIVFPLYPQYAAATTGSTTDAVFSTYSKTWNVPPVTIIPDFYDDKRFIGAFGDVARPLLAEFKPDHVLFSFHGLPEQHLLKTSPVCLQSKLCCESITPENRYCYRAQCCATSRCLSQELNLDKSQWSISFQSRLGKAEWIKPYTTDQIVALAKQGVRRLAVVCPAFVADCLETIEEIGMEAKHDFIEAGGEELVLVPSLNSHPSWVKAVSSIAEEYL